MTPLLSLAHSPDALADMIESPTVGSLPAFDPLAPRPAGLPRLPCHPALGVSRRTPASTTATPTAPLPPSSSTSAVDSPRSEAAPTAPVPVGRVRHHHRSSSALVSSPHRSRARADAVVAGPEDTGRAVTRSGHVLTPRGTRDDGDLEAGYDHGGSADAFSPGGSGRSAKSDTLCATTTTSTSEPEVASSSSSTAAAVVAEPMALFAEAAGMPTLEDTLGSTYLRRQFAVFLAGVTTGAPAVTDAAERALWTALTGFYTHTARCPCTGLLAAQQEYRARAQHVLAQLAPRLPAHAAALARQLADPTVVVTCNLFHDTEMELYAALHERYLAWLRTRSVNHHDGKHT